MNTNKEILLEALRSTVKDIQSKILQEKTKINELSNKSLGEIKSLKAEDQMVYMNLKGYSTQRLEELAHLHGSPFFVRCDVKYDDAEIKTYYFAKHSFTDSSVYSWIAPVASVRFEKPGPIEYKLPNGTIQKAILLRKEQYMIVDGKVIFFSVETIDSPRDLIYQEHFSIRKGSFALPEIVAVMEKAQDMVIRAHHIGPFVISGPAGSGKTTLALHRVAYLVQAPDTSELYPRESVIVFVQDNGTKDYFSHLLPELGIHNVLITTFFEWASAILGLLNVNYISRSGTTEQEKDIIELNKLNLLHTGQIPEWNKMKTLLKKLDNDSIDRIDLATALVSYFNYHKKFEIKTVHNVVGKKGEITQKTRKRPLEYSLIVVDEFQNYMPEQLLLLNNCLNEKTKSVIYVGDIAQQIYSGTLRSWNDIGVTLNADREVRLHKVYRNTKQILDYIKSLGYKVEIPEGLKMGPEVCESIVSPQETIEYIQNLLATKKGIIGVVGKQIKDVVEIKNHFSAEPRVYAGTMADVQGVEFDIVCLVGIHNNMFSVDHLVDPVAIAEKKRIFKDLLYVALTRAIQEMHILGTSSLKEATKDFTFDL
jgi:DNA helicase IV